MAKLSFSVPIYPFHIDAMGHVNNIVYVQWMEIGRVRLLEAIALPIEETVREGVAPVLVETTIRYKVPLYLGDKVTATIWLSVLKGASARMEFEFFNQDEALVAVGSQRGLFIDLETRKPKRLTGEMRSPFEKYLMSPT